MNAPGFNRDRLIKLLNLASSDNDPEALSAIRNAHSMVRKAGLSWELLIEDDPSPKSPRTRFSQSPATNPKPPPKEQPTYEVDEDDIWNMISYVKNNCGEQFDLTFINDVERRFEESRRLTWKQLRALRNIYGAVQKQQQGGSIGRS